MEPNSLNIDGREGIDPVTVVWVVTGRECLKVEERGWEGRNRRRQKGTGSLSHACSPFVSVVAPDPTDSGL